MIAKLQGATVAAALPWGAFVWRFRGVMPPRLNSTPNKFDSNLLSDKPLSERKRAGGGVDEKYSTRGEKNDTFCF